MVWLTEIATTLGLLLVLAGVVGVVLWCAWAFWRLITRFSLKD